MSVKILNDMHTILFNLDLGYLLQTWIPHPDFTINGRQERDGQNILSEQIQLQSSLRRLVLVTIRLISFT